MLRPFLMFPKTSANMISFTASHSPLGLLPMKEFDKFGKSFDEMSNTEVISALTSRGIDVKNVDMESAYNTIKSELKR